MTRHTTQWYNKKYARQNATGLKTIFVWRRLFILDVTHAQMMRIKLKNHY